MKYNTRSISSVKYLHLLIKIHRFECLKLTSKETGQLYQPITVFYEVTPRGLMQEVTDVSEKPTASTSEAQPQISG
jgi:hypothetical protein